MEANVRAKLRAAYLEIRGILLLCPLPFCVFYVYVSASQAFVSLVYTVLVTE